jgi:tryptophanyl-tRNA synthetase
MTYAVPHFPYTPPMRVLSGMQPSGQLHLGNYFGSMRPNLEWVGKAEQSFYFIVDLHALTTVQDAKALREYRRDIVLDYLACGFDPSKAVMFYQSDVPEHTELMWILSTLTPVGLLERAVSYKDKVEKGIPASAGLFTYPVLMAADILLYDADIIPVGKDQKQHVEMTRDIAIKFNNAYGDTLKIPEPQIREEVAVVPGTDGQKMSKSYGNTIPLFGDEKAIKKTIMGIVTDSRGPEEPKDPDTCTVYQIHKLFLSESETKALADEYRAGIAYGKAKEKLLDAYMAHFGAFRQKRDQLAADPAALDRIMAEGAEKAREIAGETMMRVRKAVGLR